MNKEEAEGLGYKVIAASPFEVGLIKGEKGIRTWFCQDFNRKLPDLDDPEIIRAIMANEEYEKSLGDFGRRENSMASLIDPKFMLRDIDSKFAVSIDGKIYNKSSGEIVPEDEPLFLLRARDVLANDLLTEYWNLSLKAGCNEYHAYLLGTTRGKFLKFRHDHPERMKIPSITEGK